MTDQTITIPAKRLEIILSDIRTQVADRLNHLMGTLANAVYRELEGPSRARTFAEIAEVHGLISAEVIDNYITQAAEELLPDGYELENPYDTSSIGTG